MFTIRDTCGVSIHGKIYSYKKEIGNALVVGYLSAALGHVRILSTTASGKRGVHYKNLKYIKNLNYM
jgi:hypothetical protein